jgi:hypothetical protein
MKKTRFKTGSEIQSLTSGYTAYQSGYYAYVAYRVVSAVVVVYGAV